MSTAKAGLAQFVDAFGREETVRMLIEIFVEKADAEAGYNASEAKKWLRLGMYLAAANMNSLKEKINEK